MLKRVRNTASCSSAVNVSAVSDLTGPRVGHFEAMDGNQAATHIAYVHNIMHVHACYSTRARYDARFNRHARVVGVLLACQRLPRVLQRTTDLLS